MREGARGSSAGRWVIGSILHDGPTELFLMIRAFAHGAMGHQIDPSRWTH